MKYIKEYKIFKGKQDFENIVHECFIPVEDLIKVSYKYAENRIYKSPPYHSVKLEFFYKL